MTRPRLLALVLPLYLPPFAAWGQRASGPVVIGETLQFQSNILKQSRSLIVAKPDGYDAGTERYPVLYLLDAETHFNIASGLVAFLAASDRMPKMIVIGIVAGDTQRRIHDLSPPSTAENDIRFMPGNGGADAFLSFIADELIPFVEETYRTRPYRLLVGHSFGGLFAVYALTRLSG